MKVDKTTKNAVNYDWLNSFKELKMYSQNKFYKIAGSLVFGIELINLPRTNEYRPYLVLYPLWKENIKECLKIPVVLQQFYNSRNFQFDIPYTNHTFLFEEAVEIIKKECPFLLDDNILVEDMISLIDNYSQSKRFSISPNSYFQAEFLQIKMEITLHYNTSKAQEILSIIKKKDWDKEHFQACGVELTQWITDLENEIDNRDLFLKQIELNKQDKKLLKIKISKLICD
ncbi:hypothetical protein [Flavobacterium gyeonganense]|uniref:Uncharacterized protein n=1 Tax=Flavobacterium gyeonganense TaxID=1310418 RepID=A0ABV5HEN9_9FLAO|nr:hypothetical protein [Flavobacterium gyeonganense]